MIVYILIWFTFLFVYCHLLVLNTAALLDPGGPASKEHKKLQLDFVDVRGLAKKHVHI